jgi:hypothetical protein
MNTQPESDFNGFNIIDSMKLIIKEKKINISKNPNLDREGKMIDQSLEKKISKIMT